MNILVAGGSHGLGSKFVESALAGGHTVTIFSRNPNRMKLQHALLKRISGDVLDLSSVESATKGQDVVICALGLPTRTAVGPPFAKRSYVLSKGTKNIIESMNSHKVKRFLCVTAIGSGDSVDQCTLVCKLFLRVGLHWLFKEKDQQDQLIRKSTLDWTIIRPTALTNGKTRGASAVIVGEDLRSGILTQVSRADVAAEMLKMIEDTKTYNKAYVISYKARFGDSLRWLAGYFGVG